MASASLQSKLHLLAVLLVAFTLLSVPLFYQVRADAQDAKEQAKSSWMSKMFNKAFKKLAEDPPEDTELEDLWAQRAREQDPNCGAECDPGGDLDGDGKSNKEELEAGRNPACNEDEKGFAYCAGQPTVPQKNETTPAPEPAVAEILYEVQNVPKEHTGSFTSAPGFRNYDEWQVFWNVTGHQGVEDGFRVVITDPEGEDVCCPRHTIGGPGLLASNPQGSARLNSSVPPAGEYTVRIESDAFQGAWDITVLGIRATPNGA